MARLEVIASKCVHELKVAKTKEAAVPKIEQILETELADHTTFKNMLPDTDADETLIHACPHMTMVLLRLTQNVHYPPHNHHMPVIMALYKGSERNFFYQQTNHSLKQAGSRVFKSPGVHSIYADTIHSVVNDTDDAYSAALHVYCGDLINQPREIWNPETFECLPYSDETYFRLARQHDSTKPFTRPKTPNVHTQSAAIGLP